MNINTQTIISDEFTSLKSHNTLSYMYKNIISCYYISIERPPLVGELSANFLRIEGAAWSA
jgi:hypothetical protein